jgi:hypothetical protein
MKRRYSTFWLKYQYWILFLFLGCAEIDSLVSEENPFNLNTIRTIQGTINEVRGMGYHSGGNELKIDMITREKEFFTITVGPVWFLRRLNVNFQEGEVITVVGSVVDPENGTVIAQEIKRGMRKLVLRDNSGLPRWKQGSLFTLTPNTYPTNRTAVTPAPGAY